MRTVHVYMFVYHQVIMKHGGQTVLPPDSAHKCTHILSQNIDSQQFHKVCVCTYDIIVGVVMC